MSDYLYSLNLALNPVKTYVFHMGARNPKMIYHVDNYIIEGISRGVVRDLGIFLDPKLTFRDHIDKISEKGRRISFQILRSFKTTKQKLLIRLFNCYVRPVLEFGSPVWSPSCELQRTKIEKIQ